MTDADGMSEVKAVRDALKSVSKKYAKLNGKKGALIHGKNGRGALLKVLSGVKSVYDAYRQEL